MTGAALEALFRAYEGVLEGMTVAAVLAPKEEPPNISRVPYQNKGIVDSLNVDPKAFVCRTCYEPEQLAQAVSLRKKIHGGEVERRIGRGK
jgi:hypothetical protein